MIPHDMQCIDYNETGRGPTIVLVPGSCATDAAWKPIVSRLGTDFRCVTTSLAGYGGTAERRTAQNTDISIEAEIVEAVILRASGPVHLVGHSFGGLVSLAVGLRHKVDLLSLTIIEAPAVEMLRLKREHHHYWAFRELTDAYITAFRAGDEKAVRRMIDFYGGPGTFAALPPRVRDHAIRTTAVNVLDWATAYGYRPGFGALAELDVPTMVVWGEESHPAVRRANEILCWSLMKASAVMVPCAAHFMTASHPGEVADLIARHAHRVERETRRVEREMAVMLDA
jgi:pimeloyl-ACP methyl ester carboxylesterase